MIVTTSPDTDRPSAFMRVEAKAEPHGLTVNLRWDDNGQPQRTRIWLDRRAGLALLAELAPAAVGAGDGHGSLD